MLTRWMNPEAVSQVLRTMDNSLQNFTDSLGEERQECCWALTGSRTIQIPHPLNSCSSELGSGPGAMIHLPWEHPGNAESQALPWSATFPDPLSLCIYTLQLDKHSPLTHSCSKPLVDSGGWSLAWYYIDQRQSPKEPESGPAKQNFEWITEMKKWIKWRNGSGLWKWSPISLNSHQDPWRKKIKQAPVS